MPILIVTAIVLFAVFLKTHSRRKKPAKAAIINMILGSSSLVLSAAVFSAAVNVYTMFVALTLGVPGTVLVVLGNFLL